MYEFNPEKQQVIEAYNAIAPCYDDIMEKVWESSFFRERTAGIMKGMEGDVFLEVGFGTGLNVSYYPKNITVKGIDIATDMLEIGRSRGENTEGIDLDVMEMDVEQMDFRTGQFDGAIATYTLSVVNDPARAFRELARVCKSNGKIVVFDWAISPLSYISHNQELVKPYCVKSGFPKPADKSKGAVIWHPCRNLAQIGIDQGLNLVEQTSIDQDDVFKSRTYLEFTI